MKKIDIKVFRSLLFFILFVVLNLIFSEELFAVELEVLTTERTVEVDTEFYIQVKVKRNSWNKTTVAWYGDEKEEYIDALGGGEGEQATDDESKTISDDGTTWINEVKFKAKKVGTAKIKIEAYTTYLGIEVDRKEIDITITIKPKLEDAYKTEPAEDADAETIKKFIISDRDYNPEKLSMTTKIVENNLDKLKKWKETLDKKIASDRGRYGQDYSYGGTRDYLANIIIKIDEGKSAKEAVIEAAEENKGALDATSEKIKKSLIATIPVTDRNPTQFIDVLTNIGNYIPTQDITSNDAQKVESMLSTILSIITNIGTVVSILMIAVIGVKYMLGSVEEKAEYKQDLLPFVIGAVLLFGICSIVKIMQAVGQAINNS